MSTTTAILSVAVIAAVTLALRFLPFVLFAGRKIPDLVLRLGRMLPCAVMGMLVVYCLKGMTFTAPSGYLPSLIAGALVVGTYLWKKNTLLSILSGTVCYMLLVQLVFV